jgi:hypothetical protein
MSQHVQIQPLTQQAAASSRLDFVDQPQCFAVGADENVQAVVERETVVVDAPCPTAERARGLVDGDGEPGVGQLGRRSEAGPPGAEDGDTA